MLEDYVPVVGLKELIGDKMPLELAQSIVSVVHGSNALVHIKTC